MNTLIVGGGSGIGLAITLNLLKKGETNICVISKDEPDYLAMSKDEALLFKNNVRYIKHNFVSSDLSVLDDIKDIDSLIITMGFGRVAPFESLTESETRNLLRVDLESIILIIQKYYHLIASDRDFYTSVVVSICGRIVSPLLSVYGAAKGGLRFFIENINCELQAKGYSNRILDVSPGSIKGTNFEGKGNNLSSLEELSKEILIRMYNRDILYIPNYDTIYKRAMDEYQENPVSFGLNSYEYKINNGRVTHNPQTVIGYLSGTFDLFHIGHLNLLRRAKSQCDYLIVSVHESGAWKGKETFIPYEERKAIVASIKYVDLVVEDYTEDTDAWEKYHYHKLFVGSDYKGTERFNRYELFFKDRVEIVYFPYTEGTSSTQLRGVIKNKTK